MVPLDLAFRPLQEGMTFNESDVARDQGGRFDKKTGAAPNVTLDNEPGLAAVQADLQRILQGAVNGDITKEDSTKLIEYARRPDIDERTDELLTEAADACEDWNYHYTSLRISSAQGHRAHAADPDAPLVQAGSMAFDETTPPELMERIYREGGWSAGMLTNPNSPPAALLDATKTAQYWDDKLVANPATPSEALDIIAARSVNGRWNEELRAHPNRSIELDRKLSDGEAV